MCFFTSVPVCMRFCTFCHLFSPAHNGLLLRKAEQDLTCAQDVLHAFAHGASVFLSHPKDFDIQFDFFVKLGRKGEAGNRTHNLTVYLLAGERLNHPATFLP